MLSFSIKKSQKTVKAKCDNFLFTTGKWSNTKNWRWQVEYPNVSNDLKQDIRCLRTCAWFVNNDVRSCDVESIWTDLFSSRCKRCCRCRYGLTFSFYSVYITFRPHRYRIWEPPATLVSLTCQPSDSDPQMFREFHCLPDIIQLHGILKHTNIYHANILHKYLNKFNF